MLSLHVFTAPPSVCGYLPDRQSRMQYEFVAELSPQEYLDRLKAGWRRFGHALFRPTCETCQACQSIRVPVATFVPDRSQKRAWATNAGEVTIRVGIPEVTDEKLELYDRFHEFQSTDKGWPEHGPKDPADYADSFVHNPFPVQEWCYRLDGVLVGVGYVDCLPEGLSAIYFYHDPAQRKRSLGTFNVLSVIGAAAVRGLPHAYLGYYVAGCRSLEYKARFQPHEILTPGGAWLPPSRA